MLVGMAGTPGAGAADAAAAASVAAMTPARPPGPSFSARPRRSHFRQGAGPPGSLASGRATAAAPPAGRGESGSEARPLGEPTAGRTGELDGFHGPTHFSSRAQAIAG